MQTVLGHARPLEILRASLRSGRFHHAWIFHGPQGVGKFTTAVEVSRILLCHQPATDREGHPQACGRCESCRLLDRPNGAYDSAHPDLNVIYKELAGTSDLATLRSRKQMNIPIDLLRETMIGGYVDQGSTYVEPKVGKKPMLDHGKVFIIDEAELLDATGQNSLLKTVEEPPPGTYIFLITTNEDRLLPTVRSRCQRVPFSPLDEETVKRWLARQPVAAALDDTQLSWTVRFARGSLGRAMLAVEYRLDAWAQSLTPIVEKVAAGKPQTQLGPTMAKLVDDFAEAWVKAHKGASKDAANKAGVRHLLGLIAELCRTRLHEVAAKAQPHDPIAAENAAQPWLTGIDLIQDTQRNLESNVALALLLDNLAIQWAAGTRLVA